jgi:hypothetical protein
MISLILSLFLGAFAFADARNVVCDENRTIHVYVRPNYGTVLNFPVKPDNVLLGGSKQFSVQYIKNDVALTPLSTSASTNMFVYMFGRRCTFLLTVNASKYDTVVRVKDPDESKIKVRINE